MPKSWGMVAVWLLIAAACAALAIFYGTHDTSFLSDRLARHHKHAILFGALAVLSLVAASFARPRSAAA